MNSLAYNVTRLAQPACGVAYNRPMQNTPAPTANKLPWVDILRFTAAFIVVLAHIEGWGGGPSWARILYYVLSRIGVPIFFLLSGYLLLSKREPLAVFFSKRAARIAIPFLAWSILYDTVNAHAFTETGFTFEAVLKMLIRIIRGPREGHLWFFYSLLGLYLLTPILRVFVANAKKSEVYYYIGLWFLVMPVLYIIQAFTPIENGFEVYHTGGYVGYFLLGWLLGRMENSPQNLRLGLILFPAGFLFTYAVFFFNIPPQNNELVFRSYPSLNIIIMSLGAFILLRQLAEKAPAWLANLSTHGGKASFGIYLIHPLVLNGISALWASWGLNRADGHSLLIIPAVALTGFAISWAAVSLIQRIPILRSTV